MLTKNASACTALLQILKLMFLCPSSLNLKSELLVFSKNPRICSSEIPNSWFHSVAILPCDSLKNDQIGTLNSAVLLCDLETSLAIVNSTATSQSSAKGSQLFIVASLNVRDAKIKLEHHLLLQHSAKLKIESDVVLISLRETAPIFQRVFYWNSRFHFSHVDAPCPKSERDRANLQAVTLNATAVSNEIYQFDTDISTSTGQDPKLKASFAVAKLEAFEYAMNFSTTVRIAGNWGYFNKEAQKWNGMVGDILENRAHFALSSSTDLPVRREVVDFMLPTSSWSLRVFYKKPRNSVALLQPFSYVLWLAIFALLMVVAIVANLLKVVLQKATQNLDRLREWTFSDSILWTLGSFCLQGWHQVPQEDCYKILILTMQLAGMVVNIAYNCVIISYLSVSANEQMVSIDDIQDSTYTLELDGNPLLFELLQKSIKFDRLKQIKVFPDESNPVIGIEKVKDELLEGSLGFIGEDAGVYHAMKHKFSSEEACHIGSVEILYGVHSMSSMIPKGSPLTRIFNYKIIRFKEVGLESLWRRRYWPQKLSCTATASFDSVDFTSVLFAFFVLLAGNIVSIIILVIELLRNGFLSCKWK